MPLAECSLEKLINEKYFFNDLPRVRIDLHLAVARNPHEASLRAFAAFEPQPVVGPVHVRGERPARTPPLLRGLGGALVVGGGALGTQ